MRQFWSRQFLVFLLTGGIAAIVNFGSRIWYSQWLDFSPAVVVAYITGMITAFILAKVFVFSGSSQTIHRSAVIFALINLIAVLQTWLVSIGLANFVLPWVGVSRFSHEIAHAVGIAIPVFTSYLGHKHWSFRQ